MSNTVTITLDESDWHDVLSALDTLAWISGEVEHDSPGANLALISDEILEQLPFTPELTILSPGRAAMLAYMLQSVNASYRQTKTGFVERNQ